MFGQGRPFTSLLAWLFLAGSPLVTTRTRVVATEPTANDRLPTPLQEDATLHDVQFVGSRIGWAVGDRGVVWRTTDQGQSWQFVPITVRGTGESRDQGESRGQAHFSASTSSTERASTRRKMSQTPTKTPVDCTLRSVCFLTDRVGWIAGGGVTPFTQVEYGVVLQTLDGGETWQALAVGRLPPVYYARFFDLKHGIVVGAASTEHPTGALVTTDGGETWTDLTGERSRGWRAADFPRLNTGVVTGLRGQVALAGAGQLLKPRISDFGLHGLRGVKLQADLSGWLVGDGGLVLDTKNAGIVWEAPPTPFLESVKDIFDFHAVDCQGTSVWIAGDPGSVIWHSNDSGQSWQKQLTGQSLPIHRLSFATETDGCAVGALGLILHTDDAGQTWTVIRGANRRAALMAVQARPNQVSFGLLAKYSGELGYRSVVSVVSRQDIGPDGHKHENLDLQLDQATLAAGGSVSEIGWQLPINHVPGLEQNADRLVAEWMRHTEGRLHDKLLGKLVGQLRTWRPSVVILGETRASDASTRLVNEAMQSAIRQAADPTRFIEQTELAALYPWRVARVYTRLRDGDTGNVSIDPYELLPRLGRTVRMAASASYGTLGLDIPTTAHREAYRFESEFSQSAVRLVSGGDFWTGLALASGSPARRRLAPVSEFDMEAQLRVVQRQRNFRAYSGRFLNKPRQAAQLIGQLNEIVADMSDDQAAVELAQLAEDYRRLSRWDLVEATLEELVKRFPEAPVTGEALEWLFHYESSGEIAWRRYRPTEARLRQIRRDPRSVSQEVQTAIRQLGTIPDESSSADADSRQVPALLEQTRIDHAPVWRSEATRTAQQQAIQMAKRLQRSYPSLWRTPHVGFALASLNRRRGNYSLADNFYYGYRGADASDPWRRTADGEIWLIQRNGFPPKPYAVCRRTTARPVLDGLLSDDCWHAADALELQWPTPDQAEDAPHPSAFLAHDETYLYLAANLPRLSGTPTDRPVYEGRTHDADLSRFDRITFYLDLDRDYTTFYTLQIDQRGWLAESCWEDTTWNPRCYVAADADETAWRIEVAIPFSELTPRTPQHRTVWAVGIVRIVPTIGIQSWTQPAGITPRPESFGLIEFD